MDQNKKLEKKARQEAKKEQYRKLLQLAHSLYIQKKLESMFDILELLRLNGFKLDSDVWDQLVEEGILNKQFVQVCINDFYLIGRTKQVKQSRPNYRLICGYPSIIKYAERFPEIASAALSVRNAVEQILNSQEMELLKSYGFEFAHYLRSPKALEEEKEGEEENVRAEN